MSTPEPSFQKQTAHDSPLHNDQEAVPGRSMAPPAFQLTAGPSVPPSPESQSVDQLVSAEVGEIETALQEHGPASGSAVQAQFSPANGAIQRSPISVLIKQAGKKAALQTVKKFVKNKIKKEIQRLARNGVKKNLKGLAREADELVSILSDPWWVTAIGLIPIAGDIYGAGRFARQLEEVWSRAKAIERRVNVIKDKVRRIKAVAADSARKFRTTPNNLMEKMAMDAAKRGEGRQIMGKMSDPRFEGMNVVKMELKTKGQRVPHQRSGGGEAVTQDKAVVHYFRDLDTGIDFAHKFK